MFALKLSLAAGYRIILTSSSDKKLASLIEKFPGIQTINYSTNPAWHHEVLHLTSNTGVDLVLENGGPQTLLRSLLCTRRGGTVSQVGYLSQREGWKDVEDLLPTLIDRRINLRGINCGSKMGQEDLVRALEATGMRFGDIVDEVYEGLGEVEAALGWIWEGRQVGKVVIKTR